MPVLRKLMDAGVLTLTLNPCVDRTWWQVTWEGDVIRRENQSGGKGLNVARVLARLGEDCVALAPLGGETGRECETLARAEGIRLLAVPSDSPTRVIVTRAIESTFQQRQEYVPGAPLSQETRLRLRRAAEEAMAGRKIFCVCGTAPDEDSAKLAGELLALARGKGLITVLDSWGACLKAGMEACPNVIKPNEAELNQLLGREIGPEEQFAAAEQLAEGGRTVLLTLGGRGAVCACDGNLYCAPAEKTQTVNPVGSGDTFLAAWLHARIRGLDSLDALRFACHLAAQNVAVFPAAMVGEGEGIGWGDAGGLSALQTT